MKHENFKAYLLGENQKRMIACSEVIEWVKEHKYSFREAYQNCHRGDWLIWLFSLTNPDDIQLRVLTAANCANTIRHLMTDERSMKAVDTAIAFGKGKVTIDQLNAAAAATDAADAIAYAAYSAAAAATDAADAAYAAADAANAAADAAYAKNQKQTADIVRQTIPIEKWGIFNL